MPSEIGFAQRTQKIPESAVSKKVQTLIGHLKLHLSWLGLAGLPWQIRLPGAVEWLIDGNVVFLLHAIDQLLDQFIELPVGAHLLKLRAHVFIEHLARFKRLLDGLPQLIESLLALIELIEVPGILKAALEQIVGERIEQVLHAHFPGGISNIFGILDEFHEGSTSPFV